MTLPGPQGIFKPALYPDALGVHAGHGGPGCQQTRHQGTASTRRVRGKVSPPPCRRIAPGARSAYSLRNASRPAASDEVTRAAAFTSMGRTRFGVSMTKSTSIPVAVRQ